MHLAGYHALRSNPQVMQHVPFSFSHTFADSQQSLLKILNNPNEYLFAALTESNDYIGMGGIAVKGKSNCAEIGYSLLPTYWGKGAASFIARWLIDYGFATLRLQTIRAISHTANKASIKVLEKAGMAKETTRSRLNRTEVVYVKNFAGMNN